MSAYPDSASELRDLSTGVRAFACIATFVICYFNAVVTFKIGPFQTIYADMLGGKPLPITTTILCQGQAFFFALALLLPIGAALAACLIRRHRPALFTMAAILVTALLQLHFTWSALAAPLMAILSGMTSQQ